MSDRRKTFRFTASVAADSKETLTATLQEAGTVEEVQVRFYRGPELAVEVYPFAQKGSDEDRVERDPLVELIGKNAIVGDADSFVFSTVEPVEKEDEIGIEVSNTAASYDYDVVVDITVDYAGGSSRSILSFLGVGN